MTALWPPTARQRFLLVGGSALALLALGVLLATGLGWYPQPGAQAHSTRPLSALVFLGLGLGLAWRGQPVLIVRRGLQRGLLGLVFGGLLLGLGGKLGLLPFANPPGWPALLSIAAAASGLLLCVEQQAGHPNAPGEWLGVLLLAHGALLLMEQGLGVVHIDPLWGHGSTGAPTGVFCLLGGALLVAAHPDGRLMSLIGDAGIAGALLRRTLPLLMLSLPALGALRWAGERAGWYGTAEGLAYMILLAVIFVGFTALYGASVVRRLEHQGQQQAALLEHVIEDATDLIFVKDLERRYILANRVGAQTTGLAREQLMGLRDEDYLSATEAAKLRAADELVLKQQESLHFELHLTLPQGVRHFRVTKSPLRLGAGGTVSGLISIAQDVTESKRHQEMLSHQATHDALTGLPNRSLLRDRLQQALALAERHQHRLGLLVLDLDDFKRVNEELSYEVGDQVLSQLAQRLAEVLRRGDTLARVYGDEFLIVLTELEADRQHVLELLQRVMTAVSTPIAFAGQELRLSASLGLSLYPDDATTLQDLERNAEVAMYRAKERGKNRFEVFEGGASNPSVRRIDRERELRLAIEQGQLELHCQPKVALQTGQIAGAEGLVRWRHPTRGLIAPADFIPLAEESGLIVAVNEWVFSEARRLVLAWSADDLDTGPLAINLSGRQLQDAELAERLMALLDGAPPGSIELEVTETTVLRDQDETARILHRIHEMGFHLALDDFGTGYSSLSFLRKFPISSLKIDRSFVRDLHSDPGDAAIARTVIAMAHALKLEAVAEGVETAAQLRFLHHHGCDLMQGWLFSKAVPASEFAAMVSNGAQLELEALGISLQRRLLLVDDDLGVLHALKRVLRREGYTILTAGSGEEALQVLSEHAVQVIISDQRMGGMNGAEMLARAAEIHPETIRIMLTGYTELRSVIDAVNRGSIYKFLTKPWDDRALREHVRDAFTQYQAKFGA